jgi:hypothetical protein
MKLPVLDNDPNTRELRISWHVRPGQFVEKDDPVCDVSLRCKDRLEDSMTAATLFAACQGTISRLFSDRVDRASGSVMVNQGNPLCSITRDAKWERGFAYLPAIPQSTQAAPSSDSDDSDVHTRNPSGPARPSPAEYGRRPRRSDSGPGALLSGHRGPGERLPPVFGQTGPAAPPPRTGGTDDSEARSRPEPPPTSFAVATMGARYSQGALAAARAILAAAGAAGPGR